ncbi:RBBP9/YdeN family alpha/beta hydrolase [Acinetobacter larvae]|uniref:Esterase n=1 Tax=Acinetobacter larvae TaxID=1789224 RepID=A0A1B2LXM4_9GAMM|nr:alpha/beta fold hydrolase [Acinetobacter larvae]AOA57686.1 esterase [Acinetobacter larvae]
MIHSIIVPGVGGSESNHWQTWLQQQLMFSSRVEQKDWQAPVLSTWVEHWVNTVKNAPDSLQIIAHSFGCLTSVAALAQHPELAYKVKKMVLVAPANPSRFSAQGFAQAGQLNFADYFRDIQLTVATDLIMSENDPWFAEQDVRALAQHWQLQPRNLGQVGHINVAAGFGPFPEIFEHLLNEQPRRSVYRTVEEQDVYLRYAI